MKHCSHCDSEQCYICKPGYYYSKKNNECFKCKIENCEQCERKRVCSFCKDGYFWDAKQKKCLHCSPGCLKCSSLDRCYTCPVNRFVLITKTVIMNKPKTTLNGLLGAFLNSLGSISAENLPENTQRIQYESNCLEKCPSEVDGADVVVNFAERKCVTTASKMGHLELSSLPDIKNDDNFLDDMEKLKMHYIQEIAKVRGIGANKVVGPDEDVAGECTNNGAIKKIFRGNLASYYICRCLPQYVGDICQIPVELHRETQSRLVGILDKIHRSLPQMKRGKYKQVMTALINFNKFKIEAPVISRIIDVLAFLLDRQRSLDNKKKLYKLYDAIVLSVFDMIEDIKKRDINTLEADFDDEKALTIYQKMLDRVVNQFETSFENISYSKSFLKDSRMEYVGLNTYSFIISEYPLVQSVFRLGNPNIDSSFNTEDNTQIELISSSTDGHLNSKYNVQFINFSIVLFQDHFSDYEMITNAQYLKLIDSYNPHVPVINNDALVKDLRVRFPLLTIPGFMDIKSHIYCRAFSSKSYEQEMVEGVAESFDEDTKYASCLFENMDSFSNRYFAVFIKKRDDKD